MKSRRENALEVRIGAAQLAAARTHPTHRSNGDESRFRFADITGATDPRRGNARSYNGAANNWLLPMAFPQGSPTHPSYGAGHATVAGACVTILKAWFDHGWELKSGGARIAYEASADGMVLNDVSAAYADPLTVEGELNKIAGNISVGRNWAGVDYYTDYIESMRMGEQIALGLLQEQKLTYGENFSLTVPLFDGTTVRI